MELVRHLYRQAIVTRLGALLFAVTTAAALAACGSSGVTNTTGPTPTHCQITATSSPLSFGVSGGDGTVSISVNQECGWTATAQAGWITITSANSGQGAGSVNFHVAANPDPVARNGSIAVGDQHSAVTQAAAPCQYAVTAPEDPLAGGGGNASVSVQTNSLCNWTATSDASWVTVAPASGSGNASVRVTAAPNTGGQRSANVTVAGRPFVVIQLTGRTPDPDPKPTPTPSPAPPQQISLSGRASGVQGTCPALTFTLSNHTVLTSPATAFAGGPCKDLTNDTQISVTGTVQTNGTVAASKVTFGQ